MRASSLAAGLSAAQWGATSACLAQREAGAVDEEDPAADEDEALPPSVSRLPPVLLPKPSPPNPREPKTPSECAELACAASHPTSIDSGCKSSSE